MNYLAKYWNIYVSDFYKNKELEQQNVWGVAPNLEGLTHCSLVYISFR